MGAPRPLRSRQPKQRERGPTCGGFFVGIGDGATFWGTESVRDTIAPGSTCSIDKNGFYYTGVGVGIAGVTVATAGAGDVALGGARLMQNEQRAAAEASELQNAVRTYQTYTKTNPITGEVYTGRTSGYGTAAQNVAKRDSAHEYNEFGFDAAVLESSSSSYGAIRGREQQLIDLFRQQGNSANKINGVSPTNPNRSDYLNWAQKEFGG